MSGIQSNTQRQIRGKNDFPSFLRNRNMLGSDGRKWVWKERGQGLIEREVQGTKKFGGGSMMMWECMTWDGVGYATHFKGTMDADLYVSILEDEH